MGSKPALRAPINDQFGWGASVTSNYGLATEFNNNYAAGHMAVKPTWKP
jgi:long-chain fatty acid transport protein